MSAAINWSFLKNSTLVMAASPCVTLAASRAVPPGAKAMSTAGSVRVMSAPWDTVMLTGGVVTTW